MILKWIGAAFIGLAAMGAATLQVWGDSEIRPQGELALTTLNHTTNDQIVNVGTGRFQFQSSRSNAKATITIYYHQPKEFSPSSRVLLVIPGAGRNAQDYRDSWVAFSEQYNVLVISPSYPKKAYSYAGYHLAGVLTDIELRNFEVTKFKGRVNKYHVADDDIVKGELTPPDLWLFRDFDEIFEQTTRRFKSTQQHYDLFGHSAGGQILHRMAMLYRSDKVGRIVAANAGTYTLPTNDYDYPFGLKSVVSNAGASHSRFANQLVLLLGELDNQDEQRGTMLHTPLLDWQGLGRLERGQFFFRQAASSAAAAGEDFHWRQCVVKGVGHEYKAMGAAAAKLLYADESCASVIAP